ncbi:MAG: hypothetical protein K8S15_12185 [Candidatus Aegiribacteria sp.]|nr:hypothetical protein [Candidatus Aegiribacteria sp.]
MKLITIALLILFSVSAHSVTIDILSEYSCPVEMITSIPVRIDSCQLLESGGLRISASQSVLFNDVEFNYDSWTIVIDSDWCPMSCDRAALDNSFELSTAQLGGSGEMWLIACAEQGDTLWTCALEGTDEFHVNPFVTEISDGRYLVNNDPDCHSTCTEIQSISAAGEMICHYSLNTDYLLDLPEPIGETAAYVHSLRMTSSGDILIGGAVQQWFTSPVAGFVCLLDGDTGNPLWRNAGYFRGMASVYDAVETSSGHVIAVGTTARSVELEETPRTMWGTELAFIAVLDATGTLQKMVVCDLDIANCFYSIIETDQSECEFLIVGTGSSSYELVFLKVIIST